jgi:hypothetical protein
MNEWHIYIVNAGRISEVGRVKASNEYNARLKASKDFGVGFEILQARLTPFPAEVLSPLIMEEPKPKPKPKALSEAERKKLVDKARKLVALSKSPNEHEAASAAEKMQALVAEYNLSMLEVMQEPDHVGNRIVIIDREIITASNPWRRRLANALAALYFCKYFYTPFGKSKNQHCFVGLEANVAVTKVMFTYLLGAVNALATKGAKGLPKREQSPYRVTFREACTSRLCARIHERIEQAKEGGKVKTETGTTLPALLSLYEQSKQENEDFVEQVIGELKSRKTKVSILHTQGFRDGDEAGQRIGLDTQVGSDERKRLN